MAKAFNTETALRAVQKKSNDENFPHTKSNQSKLYKDYFSLETGEPIALETISKRVQRRFADIDRASVGSMLDLFFIHTNWKSFYQREDSFSSYIKQLGLSRTHAYGILNSVELLNQYFSYKGNQTADLSNFMNEITSSIEDIGISKLIIISAMKNEIEKFGLVDRLLEGEEITAEALRQKPEKKEKPKTQATIILDGNDLKVGDTLVLTFQSENKVIRKTVLKTVEKWYLKSLEPKKENK